MQLFPISLSIGVLAGIWAYVSITYGILPWPCFVGWAIYFFLGANKDALVKAIPPVLVGLFLTWLTLFINTAIKGNTLVLSILVVVLAFLLTFMMNISWLAAAPAAFATAAIYFAVGDPVKVIIPLGAGLILGYISTWIPGLFAKPAESESK
jgi:hypothetical protein